MPTGYSNQMILLHSFDLLHYTNSMSKRIIKTNDTHKTVTYVILEPDSPDLDGDYIDENEIIKTAHDFVENLHLKKINYNHQDDTDTEDATFVESFIAPVDIEVGEETIKK